MFSFLLTKFCYLKNIKKIIILLFFFLNLSSSITTTNNYDSNQVCAITTYDNLSITEECLDGPRKKERILQYKTFDQFISAHHYKHNGLPFYSSFYVDTDFHHFWDFMDGGMTILLEFIIALIIIIAWIPFICCWKYNCCIFDECCIDRNYCIIFWNILTYLLFAAIFSFIIICIIFAE